MMLKHRLQIAAVTVATLLGTLAMATPASAATPSCHKYYQNHYCVRTATGMKCYTYGGQPIQTPTPPKTVAPAPTQPVSGLTADEQQMLNLVNGERSKLGIAPLKADLALTKAARAKSQDMINLRYFSHQSPTYGSPFDLIKTYGIAYKTAGENIAGNGSVTGAHTSLMNSPGHRANILKTSFNTVGIGAVKGGQYGMMFTQLFVGR